ncbi:MAG: TonB-dependent receptor [Pyrinomonadaceae bacterium]
MRFYLRCLSVLLVLLVGGLVSVGMAQSDQSAIKSGSVHGQVFDEASAVIVGADVALTNDQGVTKTAVTDKAGNFTFTGIAPGVYSLTAGSTGFAVFEKADVEVTVARRTELKITLAVALENQSVTVTSEPLISTDPENNTGALVLRGTDLDSLPDDPDELAAALQALAGPSAGPNGGQFFIDGFSGGRLPPKEAIREIRINQNPFSAEFDRLGFGRVEILTRPGSDKWRGSGFFNFNNQNLNSRNPYAINRAPHKSLQYGGNISGPIVSKKSSFFLDITKRDTDDNAVISAIVLGAGLNPVPLNLAVVTPSRFFTISPRFDYALNAQNTLVARYSFTRRRSDNLGVGGFSLPQRAYASTNTENQIQLTETAILTPTVINETRFQFVRSENTQTGDNSVPTVNVSSAFSGGGAQVGNNFTNTNRFELQNFTTWAWKQHALKAGGRVRNVRTDDSNSSGFGGSFTFSGFNQCLFVVGPCAIPSDQQVISSIDQYRQKLLGNAGASYNPNQFSITVGNPLADVSQTDLGLFVQDDWRLRSNFTLSLGLRYENQSNISSNMNFAPRVGFAWSPGGGGARQPKTVLRGGFGVFYDRFSENFTLQEERLNGITQRQYILRYVPIPVSAADLVANQLLSQAVFTQSGVTNAPTAAQLAALAPSAITTRVIADDLQSPYTMQGAFSLERQLPFKLTGSATLITSRTLHVLRSRNINAPLFAGGPRPMGASAGNVYRYESTGRQNQNQLIVSVNTRFNPKFTIFSNYILSKISNDSDGAGSFPAYSYSFAGEYGRSGFDVRHRMIIGGSFTLPWDVRLNPFVIASSGVPFNITSGEDTNGDSVYSERPTFARLAGRCDELNLNSSFCTRAIGQDPNAIVPRNFGQGPASFIANLRVSKTFGFVSRTSAAAAQPAGTGTPNAGDQRGGGGRPGGGGPGGGGARTVIGGPGGMMGGGGAPSGLADKKYTLTFSVQASNLLNTNNKGVPIGSLSSPLFGQSVSTGGSFGFFGGGGGGGGGGSSTGNRRVELQLRFGF